MKTNALLSIVLALVLSGVAYSQETSSTDDNWSVQGKNRTRTLGFYGGLYGAYSPVGDRSAQWYSARVGVSFNHRWGIGLAGSVLNYDYELSELVTDGTYRLQAGYTGMFVERMLNLAPWSKINLSWTSGAGVAFYQYNKDFREDRPWYEETIDTENFAANELGLELQFKTFGRWWAGLYGSYRLTSPIKLMGTDERFLTDFSAGVSLKYGLL
ncbi:MAG: hypothetical protein V2B15_05530 [Bacteroidota bacterium]